MPRGPRRAARRTENGSGAGGGRLAAFDLGRASDVAVMQAAHFGNRDDRAKGRRLDRPFVGCILVEGEVGASPVIVLEHDDMV